MSQYPKKAFTVLSVAGMASTLVFLASACGGSGGTGPNTPPPPPNDRWQLQLDNQVTGVPMLGCFLNVSRNPSLFVYPTLAESGNSLTGSYPDFDVDCIADGVSITVPAGSIANGSINGTTVSFDFGAPDIHFTGQRVIGNGGIVAMMRGMVSMQIDFGPPHGTVSLSGPWMAVPCKIAGC